MYFKILNSLRYRSIVAVLTHEGEMNHILLSFVTAVNWSHPHTSAVHVTSHFTSHLSPITSHLSPVLSHLSRVFRCILGNYFWGQVPLQPNNGTWGDKDLFKWAECPHEMCRLWLSVWSLKNTQFRIFTQCGELIKMYLHDSLFYLYFPLLPPYPAGHQQDSPPYEPVPAEQFFMFKVVFFATVAKWVCVKCLEMIIWL